MAAGREGGRDGVRLPGAASAGDLRDHLPELPVAGDVPDLLLPGHDSVPLLPTNLLTCSCPKTLKEINAGLPELLVVVALPGLLLPEQKPASSLRRMISRRCSSRCAATTTWRPTCCCSPPTATTMLTTKIQGCVDGASGVTGRAAGPGGRRPANDFLSDAGDTRTTTTDSSSYRSLGA